MKDKIGMGWKTLSQMHKGVSRDRMIRGDYIGVGMVSSQMGVGGKRDMYDEGTAVIYLFRSR